VRRNALVTSPGQGRTFKIELSKYEFCKGKKEVEIDDYTVYVYSLDMLAIEKVRALCQQLPEYEGRSYKTARARDFYDIYGLVHDAGVNLAAGENAELIKQIFGAKKVPLSFMSRLHTTKNLHAPDWRSVQESVTGELQDFDFYFDFVIDVVKSLEPLWIEQPPE
jgi:hypothetical protein